MSEQESDSIVMNVALLLATAKVMGFTASAIATAIGVKNYLLTNWKTGRSKPSPEQFEKLENFIKGNVPSDILVEKEKNQKNHLYFAGSPSAEEIKALVEVFKSLRLFEHRVKVLNLAYELRDKESGNKQAATI